MEKVILLRYGEIYLKGKNRKYFEDVLIKNAFERIKEYGVKIEKIAGRFVVTNVDENQDIIVEKLKKVFGLISVSIAYVMETNLEKIKDFCKTISLDGSFKVETARADKSFPIKSIEFSAIIGEIILNNNQNLKVDLHNPKHIVDIDIRENGKTYVSFEKIKCLGGMPVSTSGKGILMLSGGIDSPVAGYLMAKRGLEINCVYFHSHPYTSEQAKQKVVDLAKVVSEYSGKIKLFVVPFTEIQERIHFNCDSEFTITIMRRFMYKIAEMIGKQNGCSCLITGENLAQVASQTVQGITCSNSVIEQMPVFRPLISFDKNEIIEIARNIGTFEISNLPYQDCCTVFVPKKPIIKPKIADCIKQESKIDDIEELIEKAISNAECIEI
ncbi:MAG: tRNA 4-thiouridine(8) synthase ThiI [Clostridia bacterium]|nr:tRNA 4-thiouridine(8) synthase ThiI [Clostridia bacterium]